MFRTIPLSIIRSFSLYTQQCIYHTGLLTAREQDQDGTQFHPEPARCRHAVGMSDCTLFLLECNNYLYGGKIPSYEANSCSGSQDISHNG